MNSAERKSAEAWLKSNIEKQYKFIYEKQGNLLYYINTGDPDFLGEPVEGQSSTLSKVFLQAKAFELGVQAVKGWEAAAKYHQKLDDDMHPTIHIDWGVGFTASLFTGNQVVFEEGTTYSIGPVIKDLQDVDKLRFNPDNVWIDCVRKFWDGVASVYEMEGIAVSPVVYRSPLDLANDLRGNEIFTDFYENPELLEKLINFCAESIIKLDRHFRSECPILKKAPGGIWNSVLSKETIFFNGDPVDLISEEMGRRFNTPFVEKVASSTGAAVYYHHHSIGYSRCKAVSEIRGLTVQEICQDPNGPRLVDVIDDNFIQASLKTPIDLTVELWQYDNIEEIIEKLSHGRFMVYPGVPPKNDKIAAGKINRVIEIIKKYKK